MKRAYNTSSSLYWHKNAKQFAQFYRNRSQLLSSETVVNIFLSQRTKTLLSYAPVTSKTIMLDLGCGSGEHMKEFIPRAGFVYGIDYSKQMIELAKQELNKYPSNKYQLIQSDAGRLTIKKQSIDIIIAMGLLDYVASPDKVISECRRVLRPNGVFVFSMPKIPSVFSFFRTPIGIHIRKILFHLPPIKNAMTSSEVKQLLANHGFVIQHSTSVWSAMWMIKATVL